MTSRERLRLALDHKEADRVPLDLGGSVVSSMHVDSVYRLRQALGLDEPGTPVKVVEPYQMLGEIGPDLVEALGVDVVMLSGTGTLFGFENRGWKPWSTFEGTPTLVPEGFNTVPEPNGDLLMYPEGDRSAPPSGRMPAGGYYFDAIVRQPPLDEGDLDVEDNLEEYGPITDAELEHFRRSAESLHSQTDKAILANFGGTGFGDIAHVPAPQLKRPRGIRDVEEWYVSTITRRDHVYEIFERQCEIGLANLEKLHRVVGERVAVVFVTGTDFGAQQGPFISPQTYRDLYRPFHKTVNDWVHRSTTWKTFIHTCGSVRALLPDFIDAGFDTMNPVQIAAADMDPAGLKRDFGDRITFWGGGVDTQRILPFGSPEDVRRQVANTVRAFGQNGGFVFGSVHNIQAGTPTENLMALFEAFREERGRS
jgi:hypothetical protein